MGETQLGKEISLDRSDVVHPGYYAATAIFDNKQWACIHVTLAVDMTPDVFKGFLNRWLIDRFPVSRHEFKQQTLIAVLLHEASPISSPIKADDSESKLIEYDAAVTLPEYSSDTVRWTVLEYGSSVSDPMIVSLSTDLDDHIARYKGLLEDEFVDDLHLSSIAVDRKHSSAACALARYRAGSLVTYENASQCIPVVKRS